MLVLFFVVPFDFGVVLGDFFAVLDRAVYLAIYLSYAFYIYAPVSKHSLVEATCDPSNYGAGQEIGVLQSAAPATKSARDPPT